MILLKSYLDRYSHSRWLIREAPDETMDAHVDYPGISRLRPNFRIYILGRKR
jgi:hypothetical protein